MTSTRIPLTRQRSPLRRSPYRSSPATPPRLPATVPSSQAPPGQDTPGTNPARALISAAAIPAAAPSRCPREAHAAPRQATPSPRRRAPRRRRSRHRNPGCSDRPGDLTAFRGTTNLLRSIASTAPSSWSCPATAILGHRAWPSHVLPSRARPADRRQSPVPGQPRRPPEAGPARPHRIRHGNEWKRGSGSHFVTIRAYQLVDRLRACLHLRGGRREADVSRPTAESHHHIAAAVDTGLTAARTRRTIRFISPPA